MNDHSERLAALRERFTALGVDGFILMTGDEHLSEFTAPYAGRLAWLTGFAGSTASVAVLREKAAIFVDGRYVESVRREVDGRDWSYVPVPQTPVGEWLATYAVGKRIGYDPRLYSCRAHELLVTQLAGKADLVPLAANPIDALWQDQPGRPDTPLFVQPIERSGKSSTDKRRELAEWLEHVDADACVLTALDSIAWLFNFRASDVRYVPVAYSFAIAHRDGTADLFVDRDRLDDTMHRHLGNSVRLHPYDAFYPALADLPGKRLTIDPDLTPIAIAGTLRENGASAQEERDPTVIPKATKNPVEVAGMREAHVRDGVALTRFLHWFSIEAPKGGLTELSAGDRLTQFRRESGQLHGVSFDPITAADANAAMPHYWPTADSNAPIGPDTIYLVDSGGQYPDGTTDVTRTVAVGHASDEVRDRFTRVLKGNIALQTTVFPAGTMGSRLDAIARLALWNAGIDCPHGIGHGVGHFLNIHEGPSGITAMPRPGEAPLAPGMVLSNEPAYYKPGHFGIRTENLMVVVEREIAGAERPMLGFEAITLAPIDRRLIDPTMLSRAEIEWVDAYHAQVYATLSQLLDERVRDWLAQQTAPLRGPREGDPSGADVGSGLNSKASDADVGVMTVPEQEQIKK